MKKKILSIIFLSILFILCLNTKVNASYHASDKTVNSGANVNITITSTKGLENFDVQCTSTGGLTYKSCSSITGAAVNSSAKKISYAAIGGNEKTLGTFKFAAPEVTEKKVYKVLFNVNGTTVTSTVTVKPNTSTDTKGNNTDNNDKKSNNANLSTLGVTPKEYDFSGFSSNKTSYSVTIPNDVDSLKVSYRTADSKAKVKVTGNKNLEVGTNTIKVVVTAADGKTTKTYTIKVTKLATEDNKPGNVIDEEKDLDLYLTSLSIKGLELTPEFSSDVYSYETTINMDHRDMSEVTVEAAANNEKATVEITGNTNLVEGENLINVIVKSSNSSEQTVYQITVNKVSSASEVVSSNNIIDKIKNIKREHLIIGSFISIVTIILLIIIIKTIRNRKYNYFDEDEIEKDEVFNDNVDITKSDETNNNLVEELFKKRNNGEELNEQEKETIEDIEEENDRIFNKPKKGETVEYNQDEMNTQEELTTEEDYVEERINKRKKGKHF